MKQKITLLVLLAALSACKTSEASRDRPAMAPIPASYESPIAVLDNLDGPSSLTSEAGLAIRAALRNFEHAYEQNDSELADAVFSDDFSRVEIGNNKTALRSSLKEYRNNFGQDLDVALSHIKYDQAGSRYLAVARLGHREKWFHYAEIATFIFGENDPQRIRGMIATPIYAETYPEQAVEIFVVDPISRDDLQTILDGKNPSDALDEILAGRHTEFPWKRNVTILFVFREPPSPGSQIKTEILMDAGFAKANGAYDFVVEENAPYFVVANDGYLHAKSATIYMRAYVDNALVASKTMQR